MYGLIFRTIFKGNCKLYLQLHFEFVHTYVVTWKQIHDLQLCLDFLFRVCNMFAKFQMEMQSPFAIAFKHSHESLLSLSLLNCPFI